MMHFYNQYYADPESKCKYVLGFGTGVEVLEPEWFRNAIRDWHQKAADMYRRTTEDGNSSDLETEKN